MVSNLEYHATVHDIPQPVQEDANPKQSTKDGLAEPYNDVHSLQIESQVAFLHQRKIYQEQPYQIAIF